MGLLYLYLYHYMMYLMANKCHIIAVRRISTQENSSTQQTKTEAVQRQERTGLLSRSICDRERLRGHCVMNCGLYSRNAVPLH